MTGRMTGNESKQNVGRSPFFYLGLMFAAYGVVAALAMTDSVSQTALYILIVLPFGLVFMVVRAVNRRADANMAGCTSKGLAQRNYVKRVAVFTTLYLIAFAVLTFLSTNYELSQTIRFSLALLPGFAVLGMFWAIGRLIVEEQDEFMRMLIIRQSLVATSISLSAATMWGFLESADAVPHLDAYWWAVIWFLGLGIGAISNRIQYGTWGAV